MPLTMPSLTSSRRRSAVSSLMFAAASLCAASMLLACGDAPSAEAEAEAVPVAVAEPVAVVRDGLEIHLHFLYSAEDLGEVLLITGMNNTAEVAVIGYHKVSLAEKRGFVFDRLNDRRTLRPVDRFDLNDPTPTAINDAGTIVGGVDTGAAFLSPVQRPVLLPVLPVPRIDRASPSDINNAGVIVGTSFRPNGAEGVTSFPTRWRPTGQGLIVEALSTGGEPGFSFNGEAKALNDTGTVVGRANGVPVRFRENAAPQELTSEPGRASGISENGYITGGSGSPLRAFIVSPSGSFQRVALPALTRHSQGLAINSEGQAVGSATVFWSGERAFLWTSNPATFVDLNDVTFLPDGAVLDRAIEINDQGLILCTGTVSGKKHGFLLRRLRF